MPVAMPTWRNVVLMPEAMPRAARLHDADRRDASGGLTRPMPDTADDEAGQERRPARPSGPMPRISRSPRPTSSRPPAMNQRTPYLLDELARQRRDQERQQGHRQEAQAGLERRVAEHVLHVEREVEEHREHRRRQHEGDDRRAGEGRVAEQRQVEHRLPLARLGDDEGDEQDGGGPEQPEDQGARPALRVAADRARRRGRTAPPENVTTPTQSTPAGRVARLLARCVERLRSARGPDRDVDEEDPLPADALGQHAADERADGDGRAGRRSPDAERGAALLPWNAPASSASAVANMSAPPTPCSAAREVEDDRGAGQAAEQRGEREDRRSRSRTPPAADAGPRASPPVSSRAASVSA